MQRSLSQQLKDATYAVGKRKPEKIQSCRDSHSHSHTLLTTDIHDVRFRPQIAGASQGGNRRAEIQEYSSSQ